MHRGQSGADAEEIHAVSETAVFAVAQPIPRDTRIEGISAWELREMVNELLQLQSQSSMMMNQLRDTAEAEALARRRQREDMAEAAASASESEDEGSVFSAEAAAFKDRVLARMAAANGEPLGLSVLGSAVPRAMRPQPDAPLADQLEALVPEVVVERGWRRDGGLVALTSDLIGLFGMLVRSVLRSAGGSMPGSQLGSRVPVSQRIRDGLRFSEQIEAHVEAVRVVHGHGGWIAQLEEWAL